MAGVMRRRASAQTHAEGQLWETEAEMGAMLPQAKTPPGLPAASGHETRRKAPPRSLPASTVPASGLRHSERAEFCWSAHQPLYSVAAALGSSCTPVLCECSLFSPKPHRPARPEGAGPHFLVKRLPRTGHVTFQHGLLTAEGRHSPPKEELPEPQPGSRGD